MADTPYPNPGGNSGFPGTAPGAFSWPSPSGTDLTDPAYIEILALVTTWNITIPQVAGNILGTSGHAMLILNLMRASGVVVRQQTLPGYTPGTPTTPPGGTFVWPTPGPSDLADPAYIKLLPLITTWQIGIPQAPSVIQGFSGHVLLLLAPLRAKGLTVLRPPSTTGIGGSRLLVGPASGVSFLPVGNIASINVQNAMAELDTKKAALLDADFTNLRRNGGPIYASTGLGATGGNASDFTGSYEERLSLTFIASAAAVMAVGNVVVNTANANAWNDVFVQLYLTNLTTGGTLIAGSGNGQTIAPGYGAAGCLATVIGASGLVIGNTYKIAMGGWKAAGQPAAPYSMRIIGVNT